MLMGSACACFIPTHHLGRQTQADDCRVCFCSVWNLLSFVSFYHFTLKRSAICNLFNRACYVCHAASMCIRVEPYLSVHSHLPSPLPPSPRPHIVLPYYTVISEFENMHHYSQKCTSSDSQISYLIHLF